MSEVFNSDVDVDMVISSAMLTCDGAFGINGLSFEEDSVIWSVLMNGYVELDRSLCHPVMRMGPFVDFVKKLRFSDDVTVETSSLARVMCLGHYVTAYYAKYHGKRNTVVGYARQLRRIINSIFCQLVILRYMGESHRNDSLQQVFDILPIPLDNLDESESHLDTGEELYEIYRTRLDFICRVLCDCDGCQSVGPPELLRRTQPWRCRKRSRASRCRSSSRTLWDAELGKSVIHVEGFEGFPPLSPPEIRHLDSLQSALLISELTRDVAQRYIYEMIDGGLLPVRLDANGVGRGFLERVTMILICNITFVMFLSVTVRRIIDFELNLCREAVSASAKDLREVVVADELALRHLDLVAAGTYPTAGIPGVLRTLMGFFRSPADSSPDTLVTLGCNRSKVILEHMCVSGLLRSGVRCRNEVFLARQLRHIILSEYESVRFSEIDSDPDLSVVTDAVLCRVPGTVTFKAPLWFAGCGSGSSVLRDMIACSARRRRAIAKAEEKAAKKRRVLRGDQ